MKLKLFFTIPAIIIGGLMAFGPKGDNDLHSVIKYDTVPKLWTIQDCRQYMETNQKQNLYMMREINSQAADIMNLKWKVDSLIWVINHFTNYPSIQKGTKLGDY